jgi:hypothetical protein
MAIRGKGLGRGFCSGICGVGGVHAKLVAPLYCADSRIEISFWDLEQMKVRRGSDVCQFARYTSASSAMDFARENFGGAGSPCSC